MKTFLQMVAHDLYQKIGHDLSHTAIVFPNKRAGLFFNEGLAAESRQPVWSPTFITISELFAQNAPAPALKVADPIRLVCELYQVFREETGRDEPLDDFYFWGELLISDFDDVDKNLVDADRLFSNLQELHALMDTADFLTAEQHEAIQEFFSNFSPERRTRLKERFLTLWDKLLPIYHRFRERLAGLGIAYEGMLERRVLEALDVSQLPYDRYVFVGFNVLNRVEHDLFLRLKEAGKALFYWDYDHFYTHCPANRHPPYMHEAGEFILRNLKEFPNELDDSCFDTMRQEKRITFLEASTENAQARYLTQWLHARYSERPTHPFREKENAVVLCNESLLLPVLHAIPSEVENVNITMGFPLSQTPACSLVNALCDLQTAGYRSDSGTYLYTHVMAVLKHPYVRRLSPLAEAVAQELTQKNRFYPLPSELQRDALLTQLFTPVQGIPSLCSYLLQALRSATQLYHNPVPDNDLYNQLYCESLFKGWTLVNRLATLASEGVLGTLRPLTFKRLLSRLLTAATIPFHGEPAIGMQVMGVLETRNLDFRNLLMLSVNEGKLPKHEGDSSFIPYNLRKAFGMTTIEHKNAVYAYYFYRLIQRAEQVTLLYNTSSDGLNRGEMSRFMLQFLIESPHPIQRGTLQAGQLPTVAVPLRIEKSADILQKLRTTYDARLHRHSYLSPSALNAYLDCPMLFYYRYVAAIRPAQEVSTEIDSKLFGSIFHRAAQLTYQYLTTHGKEIQKSDIACLLDEDSRLHAFVDSAFKELFFQVGPDERPAYNGIQLINHQVIHSYLRQLLRHDLRYAPFCMEGTEQEVTEELTIRTSQGPFTLRIGGKIDRMDSKDDYLLRIIDYKTGGTPIAARDMDHLFTPAPNRPGYALQAFLYAAILCRAQTRKVAPALLYIHKAAQDDYSPILTLGTYSSKCEVTNFSFFEEEFRQRLQQLLEEIFDEQHPFVQTEQSERCPLCDFRSLCQRGNK